MTPSEETRKTSLVTKRPWGHKRTRPEWKGSTLLFPSAAATVVFPQVFLQEPAANFPPAAVPSGSAAEATLSPGHPQPITLTAGTLESSRFCPTWNSSNEQSAGTGHALSDLPFRLNPSRPPCTLSFDRMWTWIATWGNHTCALSSEEGDKGKNRDMECQPTNPGRY